MDSAYNVPVNNDNAKKASHKEKSDSRRRVDAEDRNKIREELIKHISPISSEQEHQITIMNGRTAPREVNVDIMLLHMPQLQTFIVSLPDTFHRQRKKEVVRWNSSRKKVNVGDMNIYDIEKLYDSVSR